jgi:hypothetical protein
MRRAVLRFLVALGFISALFQFVYARTSTDATPENQGTIMQVNTDQLIAIDVLLEPNPTMVEKSNTVNAR